MLETCYLTIWANSYLNSSVFIEPFIAHSSLQIPCYKAYMQSHTIYQGKKHGVYWQAKTWSCSTTHGSNSTWCNTVFLEEQPTGNLSWGLRFLWLVDIYMTLTRFKIHKNNDALGKSSLVNPKWNADRILASTVMDTFVGPMVLSQGCHKTRHYNN